MKKILLPAAALCLALLAAPARAGDDAAAPAAPAAPSAGARWTLKMEHGPLKWVHVEERAGVPTSYYYMVLKVTNPTDLPRPWNPRVEAVTDTHKTVGAVGNELGLAAVRQAEHDDALACIETTSGKIQPGETKTVAAIFGPLDPNADRIEVRIYGLIKATTSYKVEVYGPNAEVIVDAAYWQRNQEILNRLKAAAQESGGQMPQPQVEYREVRETRVWSITYERTGDEFGRDADAIRLVGEDWKILGDPQTLRVIAKPGAAGGQ
jgi:hypothetical protein